MKVGNVNQGNPGRGDDKFSKTEAPTGALIVLTTSSLSVLNRQFVRHAASRQPKEGL
jgi:hypothetical protein